MVVEYLDEPDLMVYVSRTSQRPSKLMNDLALHLPSVV